VFGNFLGFDMQGFTKQQMLSMHDYERLLVELGEKSYVPEGSKWPGSSLNWSPRREEAEFPSQISCREFSICQWKPGM
jgi:hypothetical protein